MNDEAKALVEKCKRHTPGPWAANSFIAQVDSGQLDGSDLIPIAQLLWPTELRSEAETQANARLIAAAPEMLALIETQAREIERLRKLTCATWFYMPDEGDRCWFSPHEVIDEMYDPEPGNHVFEVECATSLPSIWCAVRVTNDPDADERFTFTEHATEAEARAALAGEQ